MARLHRPSAANPNHRNTTAPTSTVTANTLQYKPPTHPLDPAAQRTLDNIQRAHTLNKIKEQYRRAAELVTESASSINERHALKVERRAREQRRKRAREAEKEKEKEREKDGNGGVRLGQTETETEAEAEAEAEAAKEIERLTGRIDGLTQRMDESIRRIVDGQVNVEAVEHCMRVVQNKVAGNGGTSVTASQRWEGRSQQQQQEEGDDEEMIDVTADDPSVNNALEVFVPLEAFRQGLTSASERYKALSMSERYSENNDYIGFRQSVHDARHGDEGPPLPHASTWFSVAASVGQAGHGASTILAGTTPHNGDHGDEPHSNDVGVSSPSQSSCWKNGNQSATVKTASSGSNQRETNREASDEEDDIAIARERISTRCPLTLREFEEPVTSRNCPHTFEKTAIFSLIDNAPPEATRRRGASARNLAKQVKCPVTGCYEVSDHRYFSPFQYIVINVVICKYFYRTTEIVLFG